MGIIKVLHLSDLHISDTTSPTFKSFYKKVKANIKENNSPPDIIFVTGDIIDRGDEDKFGEIYDNFLTSFVKN